jgi:hypothetical protein
MEEFCVMRFIHYVYFVSMMLLINNSSKAVDLPPPVDNPHILEVGQMGYTVSIHDILKRRDNLNQYKLEGRKRWQGNAEFQYENGIGYRASRQSKAFKPLGLPLYFMLPYIKLTYIGAPGLEDRMTNPAKYRYRKKIDHYLAHKKLYNLPLPISKPMIYPDPLTMNTGQNNPLPAPQILNSNLFEDLRYKENKNDTTPEIVVDDFNQNIMEPEISDDDSRRIMNNAESSKNQQSNRVNNQDVMNDLSRSFDLINRRVNSKANLSNKQSQPQQFFQQGNQALENGNYLAARNNYKQLLNIQPDSAHAQFNYGVANFFVHNYSTAEQSIRKGLMMAKEKGVPYPSIWDLNIDSNRFHWEYKKLNEYIYKNPKDIHAITLMKLLYKSTKTNRNQSNQNSELAHTRNQYWQNY